MVRDSNPKVFCFFSSEKKTFLLNAVEIPTPEAVAFARALERAGAVREAVRLADYVLKAAPDNAEALHLKAISAAREGHDPQAADLLERAIASNPSPPEFHRNICAIYERLGRLDEALAAGRRAVALDATNAESYHNLTVVHARRLELDEAIRTARLALSLDPTRAGAHMALAEALLSLGQFAEGWREYEWRFRLAGAPPLLPATDRPQWNGAKLGDGRLLLIADQGFGDVIQFSRYLPWAASRCPNLALAVAPEMQSFVRQLAPGTPMFAAWRDCPPYGAYLPFSGLPLLHGTTADNIPGPSPYLRAEPARVAFWRARLRGLVPSGYRAVGMVWAGRPTHPNNRNRSMTLQALRPLFDSAKTAFVSLQKGPAASQIAGYHGRAPIINIASSVENFEDSAAILEVLDLLISVDTSVAHLAGALGRPVWIMLPYAADWRWLLRRADTPWYPSARLFRQERIGAWGGVVERMAAEIGVR